MLIICIWGVNFVVIKYGLEELPPLLMGALRFSLVAFPAALFVPRPDIPWKWLLAYGLTISFGQFALLFSAMYVGMPAGLASLVLQVQALFTVIFAFIFLGERWKPEQLAAFLLAGCGLYILALNKASSGMTIFGFLLTVAAGASWALGNIVNRKITQLRQINLVGLIIWGAMIPPIPFLIMSYWIEGPELIMTSLAGITLQSIAALIYLAFAATLLGYGLWASLLSRYSAGTVAPFTLLVPVIGVMTAWLVLGESLSSLQIAGIGLVMLGLLVNSFGGRYLLMLYRPLKR
nr:EamA family transporter [Sansalvadorimonas sp. 2012CJ34-2]